MQIWYGIVRGMTANKRTLGEILSTDVRLAAPLFQRPYVWSQEENWEPLWASIQETADRKLQQATPRPYFMGALVLDKIAGLTGVVPTREIIDGQQRMTTLQILMEAAKALASDSPQSALLLDRVTRNIMGSGTDAAYKVWPTNVDWEAFKRAMNGVSESGRFHECRAFFAAKITTWLGAGPDKSERLNALVNALIADLAFVVIDLDNEDDGQLIFETLNSLGAPLLPSDLVKNLLFRAAQADLNVDTEALYQQYWERFEQEGGYWRTKVQVGRRERSRLDLFLQYYLIYRLGRDTQAAHQFRDYRDRFVSGSFGTVEDALADFARVAELYRHFDEANSQGPSGRLRFFLRSLDLSLPVPLVLGIYAECDNDELRDEMLEIVESYLVRRLLGGSGSKNLSRIVPDLVAKLHAAEWTPSHLRQALLELSGNSSAWFSDGQISWRFQYRAMYYDVRTVGLAYVFARIESHLRSQFSEEPFRIGTNLQIEHLMPQKWEEHWPLPADAGTNETTRRAELIHRIGNLTILTASLNLSVSNAPWGEKRSKLAQHSVLRLNRALADLMDWTEDAIEVRSKELAELCCTIWPRE